jgi:hypothetical protein
MKKGPITGQGMSLRSGEFFELVTLLFENGHQKATKNPRSIFRQLLAESTAVISAPHDEKDESIGSASFGHTAA